ncbi:hypothetical protein BJ165DRAFT_1520232 [Panaeolus papilionaceus]|nr:hypothetical protein BJ165DRAFT_1520232 [Panaeolus papilionaceus]
MGHKRKSKSIQPPGAYHPDHDSFEDHYKAVKSALRAKQKLDISDLNNDALRPYAKAAKALTFKVNLFMDMDDLLQKNLGYLYDSTDDEHPPSYSEEYWEFIRNMPGRDNQFHQLLIRIVQWHVKGSVAAEGFITMLKVHCNSGRSDVVGCVKRYVVKYLPQRRGQAIVPELASDTDKTLRGFNHTAFGGMIVGIRERKAYRTDPRKYCQLVKNGETLHIPTSLPSFLFHEDVVYRPRKPEEGFGEGYLFLRVLRAVLTTPSTAYGDEPEGRKSSRAYDWGLKSVPPKIAAAIAAIMYIGLSDMGEFGDKHGAYSIIVLYTSLCHYLGHSSARSKAVMKKITSFVPHLQRGSKAAQKRVSEEEMLAHNPLEDIVKARSTDDNEDDNDDDDDDDGAKKNTQREPGQDTEEEDYDERQPHIEDQVEEEHYDQQQPNAQQLDEPHSEHDHEARPMQRRPWVLFTIFFFICVIAQIL